MAFNRDLALKQLRSIYSNAEKDILNIIAKKKAKGNVTQFERSMLNDVNKKLKELGTVAEKYTREAIPQSYKSSRNSVLSLFDSNDIDYQVASNFGKIHKDAVKVMQQNFYNNMQAAHNFVGREIKDKIRKAQLEVATQKLTTGQTIRQTKKNLIRKLSDEGLSAYKDSAGRKWTLDRYAEMSARTVIGEATNKGTFNQLRSMDRDLVQLTSHASPCPICSPLEGRVYSLSGESDRFPSVDNALPNRYGVIHPNCIHRFVPYVVELAEDVDKDAERSNKSFDKDPRTKEAKRAYRNQQQLNQYRQRAEQLKYKMQALDRGTDEYKKVKSQLDELNEKIRDLEKKLDLSDAALLDDIYRATGQATDDISNIKTSSQANKFMKNKYNVDVDFENYAPEVIRSNIKAYQEVIGEFGDDAFRSLNKVGASNMKKYSGTYVPIKPKVVNGNRVLQASKINLNKSRMKVLSKIDEVTQYQKKKAGRYTFGLPSSNRKTLMAHELGHHLEYKLTLKRFGYKVGDTITKQQWNKIASYYNNHKVAKEIQEKALKKMGLPKWGKESARTLAELGKYSRKNYGEFVAEAVADYTSGTGEPLTISKKVVEVIEEML